MKRLLIFHLLFILEYANAQTVALHPENPHYLIYNNKPLIIISSGEHYGAVINLDFDYAKYLATLHQEGMNYTRIFSGFYMEKQGEFGIKNNTLAPKAERMVIPWVRSDVPGTNDGSHKFDLDKWDSKYFARLIDFMKFSGQNDIIVELTLFTSIYSENNWSIHPFNPDNNVNHLSLNNFKLVNTLTDPMVFSHQEKLVRKLVRELNEFDNLIFEIQNEPWADNGNRVLNINEYDPESGSRWVRNVEMANGSSLAWQKRIGEIIAEEEKSLPKKHLIAQNYCNFKYPVPVVEEEISIMNFHYVYPENVIYNYGFDRVISFDESGFAGPGSDTYRKQAWNFILSGGGIFNNLDYSFYPGTEDGKGINEAPGGGDSKLRSYLRILKNFMEDFDFIRLKPDFDVILHAPGCFTRCLSEPGKQYAIYLEGGGANELNLELPSGNYLITWLDVKTGNILENREINAVNDPITLKTPVYEGEIALMIKLKI